MKYYGIGRHKSAIAKVFIIETEIETEITEITEKTETETETTETEITKTTETETETTETTETETETTETEITETKTIISINNKTIYDYFQNDKDAINSVRQFLTLDDNIPSSPLNIIIQVSGGGNIGQQKAISLALARTFYQMGFSTNILKKKKLLTQDSRVKERRKYGLKKARKAPQYSKR